MKQNDLQEYIGILVDMENNIYLQNALMQKLKDYSMSLGKPKTIEEPKEPIKITSNSADGSFIGVVVFFVFGVLLFIWGINLLGSPSLLAFLPGLFLVCCGGALVLVGLVMIPGACEERSRDQKKEAQYIIDMRDYKLASERYKRDVLKDKERIEIEKVEKSFVDSETKKVESRLKESKERLKEMYELGIVYPKYRNMVMINSVYEYLKSGRCDTLEGSTGAYNILENEMRLNLIVLQLDQVITKLGQIKQNQYMLYSAIERSNELVYEIANSTKETSTQLCHLHKQNKDYTEELRSLQTSSSVTNYNLERINKELHYMNRMKYYAGEYNGTFYNQLP